MADFFFVFIIWLLKDGGWVAVVLFDGIFFGEGVKICFKEELLACCNFYIIVCLFNGVFNFYMGIKINLFFFEKGSLIKEIWYYEYFYLDGVKSYNKICFIYIKEFDVEKVWWG